MLDLGPRVLAKKEFRAKTEIQVKVYLEHHRGRRGELAGVHGLKKQVTDTKEGQLEPRREKKTAYPREGEGEAQVR